MRNPIIIVYGRTTCGYCQAASEELKVDITPEDNITPEHREIIGTYTKVPKIVIDDEFIGGYDDLVAENMIQNRDDKCIKRDRDNNFSCFTNNEIKDIVRAYNKAYPKDKIRTSSPTLMYQELQKRVKGCQGEKCWMEQSFAKDIRERLLAAFVPEMPRDWYDKPNTWLTNRDIEDVMSRYVKTHPSYHFLGVYSMDFRHRQGNACISNLCDFDISEFVPPKYSKVGAVFNLDTHDQSGSHWVALAVVTNPNDARYGTYFFDSTGNDATYEINEFVTLISRQLKQLHGKIPRYRFNDIQSQKKNTECGMYCIYFLYKFITTNLCFRTICKTIGDDDKMFRQRRLFFNPGGAR